MSVVYRTNVPLPIMSQLTSAAVTVVIGAAVEGTGVCQDFIVIVYLLFLYLRQLLFLGRTPQVLAQLPEGLLLARHEESQPLQLVSLLFGHRYQLGQRSPLYAHPWAWQGRWRVEAYAGADGQQ